MSAAGACTAAPPQGKLGARLVTGVLAGAVSGTLVVTFGITLAALIFSGDLAGYLPAGIGIVLASSCVLGAAVALLSSYKPVIAAPQENTTVILAVVAAGISHRVADRGSAFPTVVAALSLAAVATGVLFLVLGLLRLGKVVRFVPYPVVGGFLAATGWLLAQGSLSVMTGRPVTSGNLPLLFAPGALASWVPGACFGAVLAVVLRRFRHILLLPALLAGGIALFYAAIAIAGISVADASRRGWLAGPFPGGTLWPPMPVASLARVDWAAIRENAGTLLAVSLLAGLSMLLNASGLEHATEEEVDLDHELRITGIANLAAGALGGVAGYLSLSESALNHKVGARSRAPGLVCAALCGVTVVAGAAALSYFPKPVLGGLLLYLGLSFLLETVWDAWFHLPPGEYALILAILIVVLAAGFLEGIGAGLVVSSLLFAVNYARVDIVKSAIAGDLLRSKAQWSPREEAILRREGARVQVFQLEGYVFFGSAYALVQRARRRLLSESLLPVRFLLLDFRKVGGIDASAVRSFIRMRRLVEARGAELVLTELSPDVRRLLRRGGCIDVPGREGEPAGRTVQVQVSPDLDAGLEWCEEQILTEAPDRSTPSAETPAEELEALLVHRELIVGLHVYLERVAVAPGAEIYRQGEISRDLYVIESGEVEAWLDLGDGRVKRLRTMGTGSVVGELGLYLSAPRTASVRTTAPTTLYRLSMAALERMTREAPHLAAGFHRFVARLLAERMTRTTSAVQIRFY